MKFSPLFDAYYACCWQGDEPDTIQTSRKTYREIETRCYELSISAGHQAKGELRFLGATVLIDDATPDDEIRFVNSANPSDPRLNRVLRLLR